MRKAVLYIVLSALFLSAVVVPVCVVKWHTRRMVCRHEAGHALVSWLSPYVVRVTAEVQDSSGWVRHDGPIVNTVEFAFFQLMTMTCGMASAEMIGSHNDEDALSDITKGIQIASYLSATRPDFIGRLRPCSGGFSSARWFGKNAPLGTVKFIDAAICQCTRLIAEHEHELKSLESALDERGRLEHDDIEALLGPRRVLPLDELLGLK
jgi:hypothetical protein